MKPLSKYITESSGSLQRLLDKTLKMPGDRLIIAIPTEDTHSWNVDIANEYKIGELILIWSDSVKKELGTKMDVIDLTELNIQKSARGKGHARKVLKEITDWCDKNNIVLTGDPDDMFGSNLDRLYKLYAEFGMLPNPMINDKHHFPKIVRWPNEMNPDNI